MKKIIAIFMTITMLASIAAVNVNANPGKILFSDDFESGELDTTKWNPNAYFYIEEGVLKGDHHAVVQETNYYDPEEETPGDKNWGSASFAADILLYDFDTDGDEHSVALWWRDYQPGPEYIEGEEIHTGSIYTLEYVIETRTLQLVRNFSSLIPEEEETTLAEGETIEATTTTETEDGAEGDTDVVVASATIPDDIEVEMDFFDPEAHQLGMTVTPNAIYGFFDGIHLLTYNSPTVMGDKKPSPLLLINGGMLVGFDNVIVTTTDYPLFQPINENPVTTVAPTPSESLPPETQIVTQEVIKTEVVTNEDGETEIVTHKEIVSNVVTVPVADTNTGGTVGGTGAATGDMMFVVLAVMLVAVGSAIVVKKVRIK